MELIVTEKDNAARRIAEILSNETASADQRNGVNVYTWNNTRCVGLSGHVVGVDFPTEYSDWRDVQPVELVQADVVKTTTQENIVRTLQHLAEEATEVVIATDYDREGELIGKEAYELITDVTEVPIQRVRFSSITENEVKNAFANPDSLDFDLAAAGEARQTIDLLWGAALTRFLSLSAKQLGDDFISVGRVQSPTLKLIVDREREIQAFDPDDYWELYADLGKDTRAGQSATTGGDADTADLTQFEAQYFYLDDGTEQERIWDESTASETYEQLAAAREAIVESVNRRRRTDDPPEPFNTTQYIRAAGSIGLSAQAAMSVAEELYTAGYITYPRTDNTVYPDDVDPAALLEDFVGHHPFSDDAEALLAAGPNDPTAGDEETTDHPPIHPTGEIPGKQDLSDTEWRVYELVVRRFFATVADPAEWEHLKVVVDANGCLLKANGKRLLEAGYHEVYPYFSTTENYVPAVDEDEVLEIEDTRFEEKQTQPPRRRGQSRLIETMADLGLGTKATRHNTLQKLYDRGYIESDPPRPTKLAMAVVDAAEAFADRIVDEEMTAQLEADMRAIAEGNKEFDEVTAESRGMLERIFDDLHESREEIADHLQESLKADKTLGPCPECGADLLVRQSRRGSYFVGCDGFPECRYTLPLPGHGEPTVLDDRCEDHDLRHVKILDGRNTYVHGCPRCKAEAADEADDEVIGACPDCGDDEGGELAIKQLRSGSRLVGCTRYPACEYSLPLPRRGEITVTDERCPDHQLPHLHVRDEDDDDDPWELGCPICNYDEYRERQAASAVEDLDGIGEKTADKLADAGIESLDDLRGADAAAVAQEVQGVSADRIREWQAEANAGATAD